MLSIPGIDYGFAPHPTTAQLAAHGARFAGRYLAGQAPLGGDNGKIISVAEKTSILAAGMSLVLFHEWGATDMLGGHAAGVAAARSDEQQLAQLGMSGCPVYQVADFDATTAQQAPIDDYQRGYASVRGWAATGLYGGYWVVSRALAAGTAGAYTCGTVAWSGTNWADKGLTPTIMQGTSFTIGTAQCDWDTAHAADYGQWPRPGTAPSPVPAPSPVTWQETMMNALPVLKQGATGADVRTVQGLLIGRGYSATIDGVFGPATDAAVRRFQGDRHLGADGIVGAATWPALMNVA